MWKSISSYYQDEILCPIRKCSVFSDKSYENFLLIFDAFIFRLPRTGTSNKNLALDLLSVNACHDPEASNGVMGMGKLKKSKSFWPPEEKRNSIDAISNGELPIMPCRICINIRLHVSVCVCTYE